MNFLKTFFGQILRKSDVDFQNLGSRNAIVQLHNDYTSTVGGVISGLDVFVSTDKKSIIVNPGVFYSRGEFINQNAMGGGERCEIFVPQIITNLPETTSYNNNQRYLLIYATLLSQNSNPDLTKSQVIVTSRNLQTGESEAVREYNRGSIGVSSQMFASEARNISNGIPLALIQVLSDGTVTSVDTSIRLEYSIADTINIPRQSVSNFGLADNFVQSAMISGSQIITRHISDDVITSPKLAVWDGASSGTTSGSGVATGHLKNNAVLASNINPTGSLYGYSPINYVFNSSFEVNPNSSADPDIVGWTLFNEVDSDSSYSGPQAGVFRTNDSYNGLFSAVIKGADPALTTGGLVKGVALYQDISFPDEKLNNKNVMASFYMKTNNNFPVGVLGVTGITASIQFLSSGTVIGDQYEIVNYNGQLIDWTKFETEKPIVYTDSTAADGVRFLVSGNTTNAVDIFVDNFYVGLTNIAPSWSASPKDADYPDILNKTNINSTNFNSTNVTSTNISITGIVPSINNPSSIITSAGAISTTYARNLSDSMIGTATRSTGSSFYFAQKFTSTTSTTIASAMIKIGIGTGVGISAGSLANVVLKICDNNSGTPNLSGTVGIIGTTAVAASNPATPNNVIFNGGSVAISASTDYWLVFEVPYSYSQISTVAIAGVAGNGCLISNDGSTWSGVLSSQTVYTAPVVILGIVTQPGYTQTFTTTMQSMVYALYSMPITASTLLTSGSSSYSSIGTISEPLGLIYTNSLLVDGIPISNPSRQFKVFSSPGTATWQVPQNVTSITVEMLGAGAGGSAGVNSNGLGGAGSHIGHGGGGGGAGEYVMQHIDVTPGEILNIQVGPGGPGASGQKLRDPVSNVTEYFGGSGSKTRILRAGAEIAVAQGGHGGTANVHGINAGKFGGGSGTFYFSNRISIAGASGKPGGTPATAQTNTSGISWNGQSYNNGGGRGGSWNYSYIRGIGGSGGVGINVGASWTSARWHYYNISCIGINASGLGSGGGGGGGSYNVIQAAPNYLYTDPQVAAGGGAGYPPALAPGYGEYYIGNNAGSGGDGAPGIAIIYY